MEVNSWWVMFYIRTCKSFYHRVWNRKQVRISSCKLEFPKLKQIMFNLYSNIKWLIMIIWHLAEEVVWVLSWSMQWVGAWRRRRYSWLDGIVWGLFCCSWLVSPFSPTRATNTLVWYDWTRWEICTRCTSGLGMRWHWLISTPNFLML
jgi:hypothetical protein